VRIPLGKVTACPGRTGRLSSARITGATPSVLNQIVPVVPRCITVIFAKYWGKLTGVAVFIVKVSECALLAAIPFLSHIDY
jgi:hypothetical protein